MPELVFSRVQDRECDILNDELEAKSEDQWWHCSLSRWQTGFEVSGYVWTIRGINEVHNTPENDPPFKTKDPGGKASSS